jgi:hypothetical protein
VTTLPPSQCRKSRKSTSLNLPDLQGLAQASSGKTLHLTLDVTCGEQILDKHYILHFFAYEKPILWKVS